MQFRVGVVVIATVLITMILLMLFGKMPKVFSGKKTYYIVFEEAPGVQDGTPVRKSGIRIGQVSRVEFARDRAGRQDTRILVTAAIEGDKEIYEDETCLLRANLLGDAVLEFVREPQRAKSINPVAEGATVEGVYLPDPAQIIGKMQAGLGESIESVTRTSNELREVGKTLTVTLQSVNGILEDNRQGVRSAVEQATRTLAAIDRVATSADSLIGDPQSQRTVKEQLQRLPQIVDDVQLTVRDVRATVGKLNQGIDNVALLTDKFASDEFVAGLNRSMKNLDRTLAEMAQLTESLNNPDGSLGRLINDPELYQNLNRAVHNVEQVTRQLRPIVGDARVLTDKLSRHPGTLVRDALSPGPGIK
jgi:phospholipid/cholesterol/gamma-HCH transport system substrate-binding protein